MNNTSKKSTISTKPAVASGIESWIGGNPVETTIDEEVVSKQASKIESKQAKLHENNLAKENKETLSVRVPASLLRQLRIHAVTEGKPIQDIVADLLRDYLDK